MGELVEGVAQARKVYGHQSICFEIFAVVFGLAMTIGSIILLALLAKDGKLGYIALFLPLALLCCLFSCVGAANMRDIRKVRAELE